MAAPKKKTAKKRTEKKDTPTNTHAIPDAPVVESFMPHPRIVGVMNISIDDIGGTRRTDRSPREDDEARLTELAASLKAVGQLQNIMVEKSDSKEEPYILIFGARRVQAARRLGWKTITAMVCERLTGDQRRTCIAVENIQRRDLTPPEETLAVNDLLDLQALPAAMEWGKPLSGELGPNSTLGKTGRDLLEGTMLSMKARRDLLDSNPEVMKIAVRHVAAMLAKSEGWVRDRLYIGRLDSQCQWLVREGRLPLAHAREIAKLTDPDERRALAAAFAAGGRLSVSATEPGRFDDLREEVARRCFDLRHAPWRLDMAWGDYPACIDCPDNSIQQPGLFDMDQQCSVEQRAGLGVGKHTSVSEKFGACTNAPCFRAKALDAKAVLTREGKRLSSEVKNGKLTARPDPDLIVPGKLIATRAVEIAAKAKSPEKLKRAQAPVTDRQRLQEAMVQIRHKHLAALHDHYQAAEPAIGKALSRTPGAWSMYQLVRSTKLWHACFAQGPKGEAAAKSQSLRDLLNMILDPCYDNLIMIEKHCGRMFDLVRWNESTSGATQALLDALGIDAGGEPPSMRDVLPEDLRPEYDRWLAEEATPKRPKGGRS